MEIQTILFDLGNVLLDFSHSRMCGQMADVFDVSSLEMNEVLFGCGFAKQFERGQLTEVEFHLQLEEIFQRRCNLEELQRACGDIFTPKPRMQQIVCALRLSGVRLVILSNTCQTHIDWITKQYDLLSEFDHLVLSYEVGACKPEESIYKAALQSIECEPQHCLYTDDIGEYVTAARRYGLNAELFRNAEKFLLDLANYGIDLELD